jgi:hypothetical protein
MLVLLSSLVDPLPAPLTFPLETLVSSPTTLVCLLLSFYQCIPQDANNLLLGHYIENLSDTEDLVWIELYKAPFVRDIELSQWLALSPPDLVAQTLNISLSSVEALKKEKQILIA